MDTPHIRTWQAACPPSTAQLIALQAARPERYPGLFLSSEGQGWDILFAFPEAITELCSDASLADLRAHPAMQVGSDPSAAPDALPFRGGWLCMFSYGLAGLFEPTVGLPPDADFPLAWLARIPAAILVDRTSARCLMLAEAGHEAVLDALSADLGAALGSPPPLPAPVAVREDDATPFLAGVARIQDYIRAGDVFQVNLSRGWCAEFAVPPAAASLFAQLMARNPAPFSAVLETAAWAIVSSSPERLVRLDRSGVLETRPIAGTHPRSEDPEEDAAQRRRLQAHPKERAEHIMLVDLERNDLGRVCEAGSVRVPALMDITSYRHVHHIESTVRGRLRAGLTVFDALRAVFPGGTITGCPKVRTMQIIQELEQSPRRSYTGSVGYINADGGFDLNILIRTFLLRDRSLHFRAGAGIVADSVPQRELEETRAKAEGLLRALDLT